jgi:hypothetical protein
MRYEIRPLGHWTDPETPTRTRAFFRAGWTETLRLLGYEAERLGAHLVVLQVDVTEGDLRRDGMIRANAKVGHPGVAVSFDSDHGPLRYATDRYDTWQDNVRGIALALQALRAVDRYGVTHRAEQYIGFRAIPAPVNGHASADAALRWMRDKAGPAHATTRPELLYRLLSKRFHPDIAGGREDWDRLDQARQLLNLTAQT